MTSDASGTNTSQGAVVVLAPGDGRIVPLGDVAVVTIKAERRHSDGSMTACGALEQA